MLLSSDRGVVAPRDPGRCKSACRTSSHNDLAFVHHEKQGWTSVDAPQQKTTRLWLELWRIICGWWMTTMVNTNSVISREIWSATSIKVTIYIYVAKSSRSLRLHFLMLKTKIYTCCGSASSIFRILNTTTVYGPILNVF